MFRLLTFVAERTHNIRKLVAALSVVAVACVVDAPRVEVSVDAHASASSTITIESAEHEKMLAYVEERNDPRIIRSIIDDGKGEVINCVDIHLQHGFDRPIEEIPPRTPERMAALGTPGPDVQAYGTIVPRCAEGTIPQLRTKLEDVEAFPTLSAYLNRGAPPSPPDSDHHKYALTDAFSVDVDGAYSSVNIFTPPVVATYGFSLSQLWITGGTPRQTVESGIIKYPAFYPSNHPDELHVFIFYTPDDYSSQYWNGAGGFVQTDPYITLGGYIPSWAGSVVNGVQVEIVTGWIRDATGWWYGWNGHEIGYIPASKFSSSGIKDGALSVSFGGEIYDPYWAHGGITTITDMGSGRRPGSTFATSYGKASYHRDMQFKHWPYRGSTWEYLGGTYTPYGPGGSSTLPICYEALGGQVVGAPYNWHNYLFFGGPGNAIFCNNYP